MSLDPDLITALSVAVAADPAALGVRLHLADLLAADGQYDQALAHYAAILDRQPDHRQALTGAATAAEALGQADRAAAYRRIVAGLDQAAAASAAPGSGTGGGEGEPGQPGGRDAVTGSGAPPPEPRPRAGIAAGGVPPSPGPVPLHEWVVAPGGDEAEWERPALRLADVGGLDAVKRRLDLAFLAPLRNPDLRQMYGKSLRGGLLLYGPPGCGKTFLARAVAGELGARFTSVGLTDVLDMYVGESERRLHAIFATARRNVPVVMFFDELDALGHKRSQMRGHAGRNVVNVLLAELDGIADENEGVFILGATNHPWDVDAALRRPGRFDRTLLVLPPDERARVAIVRYHLRDRPAEAVDVRWVARQTQEFSGADLAHLCEAAAELALADAVASGTARPMTTDDFRQALREVRPSTRPWFDLARNFALFANDGGIYDELAAFIRQHGY